MLGRIRISECGLGGLSGNTGCMWGTGQGRAEGEFLSVGDRTLKNKISAKRDGERNQHDPAVPASCGRH